MADLRLPQVTNPAGPVVIPAVPEQSFPDVLLTSIVIHNEPWTAEPMSAIIHQCPYSYATQQAHPDAEPLDTLHVERDLWGVCETYPVVAQAIGTLVGLVNALIQLRAAQAVVQAAADAATVLANAQARLSALQAPPAPAPDGMPPLPALTAEQLAAMVVAAEADIVAATAAKAATDVAAIPAAATVAAIESQLGKQG